MRCTKTSYFCFWRILLHTIQADVLVHEVYESENSNMSGTVSDVSAGAHIFFWTIFLVSITPTDVFNKASCYFIILVLFLLLVLFIKPILVVH